MPAKANATPSVKAAAVMRREGKLTVYRCPICNRSHCGHPEFGPFCCTSCLQTYIRPLIVARFGVQR